MIPETKRIQGRCLIFKISVDVIHIVASILILPAVLICRDVQLCSDITDSISKVGFYEIYTEQTIFSKLFRRVIDFVALSSLGSRILTKTVHGEI